MLNFLRRKFLGDTGYALQQASQFIHASHTPCVFNLSHRKSEVYTEGMWHATFTYPLSKLEYQTFNHDVYNAVTLLIKLAGQFEAVKNMGKLDEVIKEAERFIKLAKRKGTPVQKPIYDKINLRWTEQTKTVIEFSGKDNASIRRASLDLTRALAELRKTYVNQWRD